uniref:Uncharacterized protein n=1 Tax=Arundo donax TaxID=35708 RepID=A0A0A9DB49_ARUDO
MPHAMQLLGKMPNPCHSLQGFEASSCFLSLREPAIALLDMCIMQDLGVSIACILLPWQDLFMFISPLFGFFSLQKLLPAVSFVSHYAGSARFCCLYILHTK